MNEQITYTVQDIERYHGGKLSPAQMNAMEKAALDDPFLADALEGYSFATAPSTDLASLQQKLAARIKKEEKRRTVFLIQPWMKIAALFILIAGGGWFIIQGLSSSSKTEVAVTTSANKQQLPAAIQPINADSASTFSTAPLTNETVSNNKKSTGFSAQEQYKTSDKTTFSQSPSESPRLSRMAKPDSNIATATVSNSVAGYTKDRIDSLVNVTAMRKEEPATGRSRTNDTIHNADVVLQKSERALEEIVVNQKAKANSRTFKKMMMQVDTLEPANGWGYFDDYIATNIKSPDELKIKPVSGEVELSFDVNGEGQPVNITVTKSLCDRCDEEAIRLLKEGPRWKNKAKKGKVKIKFTSPSP